MNPSTRPTIHAIADLLQEETLELRLIQAATPNGISLLMLDHEISGLDWITEIVLMDDLFPTRSTLGGDEVPELVLLTRAHLVAKDLAAILAGCAIASQTIGYGHLSYCLRNSVLYHRCILSLQRDSADGDVLATVLWHLQTIFQIAIPVLIQTADGEFSRSGTIEALRLAGLGSTAPPMLPVAPGNLFQFA